MDRLQKKCVFAATGLHLLLLLILLVGPAFVSSRSQPDNIPVLAFVPKETVDALILGGGNPNARPLPAPPEKPLPAQPAPVVKPLPPPPQPEKVRAPDPPKEVIKEVSPPKDPDSVEPSKVRKPNKPVVEFTPVIRNPKDAKAEVKARADAQAREEAREQARQEADRRRRAALAFGNAANSLEEGRSSRTTIEPLLGPGGGGPPYANFLAGVKTVYTDAWIVPDGVTDDSATVAASVTIARDGTVVSSRITRSSGNPAVDRSVQVTLDRVKQVVPLPKDAKENQRTVTINFNVKAKRALG